MILKTLRAYSAMSDMSAFVVPSGDTTYIHQQYTHFGGQSMEKRHEEYNYVGKMRCPSCYYNEIKSIYTPPNAIPRTTQRSAACPADTRMLRRR